MKFLLSNQQDANHAVELALALCKQQTQSIEKERYPERLGASGALY
jgi:hypothetical protein